MMSEETEKRHKLAQRVAELYRTRLGAVAALVVGSTARAQADRYSDIDMSVFYPELPSAEAFADVRGALGANDWRKLSGDDDGGFVDTFMIEGVECQAGHITLAAFQELLDDVLERNDTDHDKHTILGGIAESVPLFGESLVKQWKERIGIYPDALAREMVRSHLDFRPLWLLRKRVAGRDTFLVFHTLMMNLARNLLGVYLGLNRLYPEHDYKRMGGLIARMTILPHDFDRRLRTLLTSDYKRALEEADGLIEETFTLVAGIIPDLDIEEAQRKFRRPAPR